MDSLLTLIGSWIIMLFKLLALFVGAFLILILICVIVVAITISVSVGIGIVKEIISKYGK